MSISAMKYALDVLDNYVEDPRCETERVAAVNLLRQAIAEAEKPWVKTYCGGKPNYTTPEQEPVAWREVVGKFTHYYDYNEAGRGEPLYAAPQTDLARVGEVGVWGDKREWVGLDRVEIEGMTCECIDDGTFNMSCAYDFARAIEDKLKRENT
jgi:hypothetical protein